MKIKSVRITDKHVFFWSSVFSNWQECEIDLGGEFQGIPKKFYSSEQYFMYLKAITFNDEEIAKRILLEGKDPKVAKDLGREVRGYDDEVWSKVRYEYMKNACYLKFSQNKALRDMLLSDELKGKGFVEGSPYDKIWGIGVYWKDASDDESTWDGENLLGKALDEVRKRLFEEEGGK